MPAVFRADRKLGVNLTLLVDLTGSSGKIFSDMDARMYKGDGTNADVSPADGAHWVELTSDNFLGKGYYYFKIDAANLNVLGETTIAITTGFLPPTVISFQLVSGLSSDIQTSVGAIKTGRGIS